MLNDIKKQLRISWKDMLRMYVAIAVLAFLGTVVGLIFRGQAEGPYVPKGIIVSGIVGLIILLIIEFAQYMTHFNLSVAMGMPRKRFFWTSIVSSLLLALVAMGVWVVMGLLELGIIWLALKDMDAALVLREIFPQIMGYGILMILVIVIIGGLCAAFRIRFGKAGGWILWALWMTLCIGGPNLWDAYEQAPASALGQVSVFLVNVFCAMPKVLLALMGGVLLVLCIWANYLCIRKQEVRS